MKKSIITTVFVAAALLFSFNTKAQVVQTKPKPPHEKIERPPKPTTKGTWVWVPGHWEWKKKSETYVWKKPRWRKAPEGKKYWHKGYWKKVKKGWRWEPGYWE